jgi:hypothetical protein
MIEERVNICKDCPFFLVEYSTCEKCACPSEWLHNNEEAVCPEGNW